MSKNPAANSTVCQNEFNEYYYTEFQKMAKEAKEKNNKNMALIYKKVAVSIQKYPFPILSSSQATLLDGVGDSIAKVFEKLINNYKDKITTENINYVEKAYNLNKEKEGKKKKGKRKAQTDTENESKNLVLSKSNVKLRKNLTNIEPYSSVWSSVVCSYILHLQTNEVVFEYNDILAMSRTLTDELAEVKKIEVSQGFKDFKDMKTLNLIENIDPKECKIKINDFLIKLAKIELKKSGIQVENNGNGVLNFEIVEAASNTGSNFSNNLVSHSQVNKYPNSTLTSNLNYSQFNSNMNNNLNSQVSRNINPFQYNNNSNIQTQSKNKLNINKKSVIRESFSAFSDSGSANGSKDKKDRNMTLDSFISSKKKYKEEEEEKKIIAGNNANIFSNLSLNTSNSILTGSSNIMINSAQTNPSNTSDLASKFLNFRKKNMLGGAESIILLVDNREKGPKGEKFPEEIRKLRPDIIIQERNLAVGDFMWIYVDPQTELEFALDFVIERKTTDDLASSIIDGRYNEQKYRLKNCGINNVYYIFEGGSANFYSRGNMSKQAINTAVYNTLNIHDINIIRTPSIEESVNFLIRFDDMIRRSGDVYAAFSVEENKNENADRKILFSEFTQSNAKTKNSTIENIFVRQLRCFSDCGAKSVDVLRTIFKCPKNIYEIIHRIESEEIKENLITTASYLFENIMELSEENLLFYADPTNYKSIKKEVKSLKKIRKTTNASIVNFYS